MDLFASFYDHPADWRAILAELGLEDKARAPFAKLSGGQKQRLFIGLALINEPEIVFLDELTTGLDPQARRAMWGLVKSIRDKGKTVFLTTHYMEEAEELCDRVAIIDHGRIVALDTPRNLVASLGAENRVVFTTDGALDLAPFRGDSRRFPGRAVGGEGYRLRPGGKPGRRRGHGARLGEGPFPRPTDGAAQPRGCLFDRDRLGDTRLSVRFETCTGEVTIKGARRRECAAWENSSRRK